MFLSIILKFQVPDINSLFGIRKKATVFDGPWSGNVVLVIFRDSGKQEKERKNVTVSTGKRDFPNTSCIFSILDAIKL